MSRLIISATHKSSGKTVISTALCALLKTAGLNPRPYKKGPDYIDPKWLAQAAEAPCYNLDFHVQTAEQIRATIARHSPPETFSLIEANKGLYDGVATDGSDSNAALAKLLYSPVIIVVDCEGITRGIAPLLLGYKNFDSQVQIGGVVLNRVGGERHRDKLVSALKEYTDIAVLGSIMKDQRLVLPERHLGLVPANEASDARQFIATVAEIIGGQIDLEAIVQLASTAPQLNDAATPNRTRTADITLGIFRDKAFGFYYPDDLETLEDCGAKLIFIDSLSDTRLAPTDGLIIGGGFPETQAPALERNQALRSEIKQAIENNLPVYAECGGLMYLTRSIQWRGKHFEMCGVLPADTEMSDTPYGRGYVEYTETDAMPWPQLSHSPDVANYRAHEFHYSRLVNVGQPFTTAYKLTRGAGLGNGADGIVYKNLLASYLHQRSTSGNWAERFCQFVRTHRVS